MVFGGTHLNRLLAGIDASLPFHIERGKLTLGKEVFEGEDVAFVAVIPAGPQNPEFLLYASTGMPGIAEINALSKGDQPIFVGDVFGRLTSGRFVASAGGARVAQLEPHARRIAWRTMEREAAAIAGGKKAKVTVRFPEMVKPDPSDGAVADACARGVSTSVKALAVQEPSAVTFYVYPDRRSKEELMGDPGHGLAVIFARALNVLRYDPAPGGVLEGLVAHEATHVLAYDAWGPPGSAFLGEGLAVWVSGRYGGSTLEQWKKKGIPKLAVKELLDGKAFRAHAEQDTYPRAGLFVAAAMKRVGLPLFAKELYPAGASDWDAACTRAGTTATALGGAVP